jgi:F-type H+-transporting ATPase subunit epsilon
MQVVIVTPEATTLDVQADFVALPLIDGEIGVLKDHAATIGRLGFGEMRVRSGNDTTRFYVDGGFVQIADNVVSILTGKALPAAQMNAEEIRQRLADADAMSQASGADKEIRRLALNKAAAQLKVVERA